MASRPFTRRKDLGQSTSAGKTKSSVLDVFIVFETGFSSEDLQQSHEGKWFILFLKIFFRVEFFVLFCFLLF